MLKDTYMKAKQRRLSHQEKTELFSLYKTGNYTGSDLSKIFPISVTAINRLLRRNGHKAKPQSELQRKYKIDETFFNTIDTEEKAYTLGLIYADGCNQTERNSVILSLKEDDKEILEKIRAFIQPDKPLQYVDTSKTSFNSSNQYRLVIANKHISERLVELGCGKAKTHNLVFPTEEQVPKQLQRHFIRGYFDGDGSISKGKVPKMDIVGTVDFLEYLQDILFNELGLKKTKLNKRLKVSKNNIRALQISGRNQCKKIKDYFYKNSTIFMKRKKEIFYSY